MAYTKPYKLPSTHYKRRPKRDSTTAMTNGTWPWAEEDNKEWQGLWWAPEDALSKGGRCSWASANRCQEQMQALWWQPGSVSGVRIHSHDFSVKSPFTETHLSQVLQGKQLFKNWEPSQAKYTCGLYLTYTKLSLKQCIPTKAYGLWKKIHTCSYSR